MDIYTLVYPAALRAGVTAPEKASLKLAVRDQQLLATINSE